MTIFLAMVVSAIVGGAVVRMADERSVRMRPSEQRWNVCSLLGDMAEYYNVQVAVIRNNCHVFQDGRKIAILNSNWIIERKHDEAVQPDEAQ